MENKSLAVLLRALACELFDLRSLVNDYEKILLSHVDLSLTEAGALQSIDYMAQSLRLTSRLCERLSLDPHLDSVNYDPAILNEITISKLKERLAGEAVEEAVLPPDDLEFF
ncbi:hypothetical protein [Gluconobacter wancherniae]|uniref:hypothetical protein n=1 Tax=Gluconobacter wancherniae TaxID=1307955 RepID=UPI001B8DA96F|nr:hypothetical protein [Gluconobacter wancherniae]MBS1089281.1 hypothetical protein [Gluconobacter wancherniae]